MQPLPYELCFATRAVSGQGRLREAVSSRSTKPCSARAPAADDSGTGRQEEIPSRIATGRAERDGRTLIQQYGCGTDVGSDRTLTAHELFLGQGSLDSPLVINSGTLADTRRAWTGRVCESILGRQVQAVHQAAEGAESAMAHVQVTKHAARGLF